MDKSGKVKAEQGRRMSIWIPEKHFWLFEVLDKLVLERENAGVQCGRSDIVREILVAKLKDEKK